MILSRDTATHTPGTRFIDPRILKRLSSLELIAKTVVSGFISGLHRAPYLGLSSDFAEHRAYMPATMFAASTGAYTGAPIASSCASSKPRPTPI